MVSGKVQIAEATLQPGDGAAVEAQSFPARAAEAAEFLLFRLA